MLDVQPSPNWCHISCTVLLFSRRSCPDKSPAWSTASRMLKGVSVKSCDLVRADESGHGSWDQSPVLFMMIMMMIRSLQSSYTWRVSCRPSKGNGRVSTDCAWTSSSRWVWGESCRSFTFLKKLLLQLSWWKMFHGLMNAKSMFNDFHMMQ